MIWHQDIDILIASILKSVVLTYKINITVSAKESICNQGIASNGTEEFRFYGEDKAFSLDEWVQEIIRRAHMGLIDSLFIDR